MKKLLALMAVMMMAVGGAIPASAAPEPPPPPAPHGWTVNPSESGPFDNINPCTGEENMLTFVSRLTYTKEHTGGVTERLYHFITTSDGWSTNGWVRGRTFTEIRPGGGYIRTTVYSVPLFEEDGRGVMFGRQSWTIVVLADGTEVVNNESPFELSCAGNPQR